MIHMIHISTSVTCYMCVIVPFVLLLPGWIFICVCPAFPFLPPLDLSQRHLRFYSLAILPSVQQSWSQTNKSIGCQYKPFYIHSAFISNSLIQPQTRKRSQQHPEARNSSQLSTLSQSTIIYLAYHQRSRNPKKPNRYLVCIQMHTNSQSMVWFNRSRL